MKNIILIAISALFVSCAGTIATTKKEYKIEQQTSSLASQWKFNGNEWKLQNDTLTGSGGPMHWGVIESKKKLPENYEITFKANMTKESLFEVMLNIYKEQYIRTYLYEIDQKIIIGKGVYKKGSDEYGKRGGPSLFSKPMKLENNKWYAVKIKVLNDHLSFSVDNETFLECSIEKSKLSPKGKLGFITNGEVKITELKIEGLNNLKIE